MRGGMVLKKEGEASWITYIKRRIENNLNFLAITEGPTGAGKSWVDHSIAYQIDPEYDPEQQTVFSFSEFMNVIRKFNGVIPCDTPEGHTPLCKRKYKVVVFEESQTAVNRREWQSKINKLFQYVISTFRHQHIIVLFNSPHSDYFDSATMKLIHARFEVKGWNKKNFKTHVKAKLLQYNGRLSKFYEHSLYVIRDGKVIKFDGLWKVPKPPKHIILPYEAKKTKFTNELNERIAKQVEAIEKSMEPKGPEDNRRPLTERQREVMELLANLKESNKYEVASEMLGISLPSITGFKQAVTKGIFPSHHA